MDPARIRINATLKNLSGRIAELKDFWQNHALRPFSNFAALDTSGPVHVSAYEAEQVKTSKFCEIIAKCIVSKFDINLYSVMSSSDILNLEITSKFAALVLKVSEPF